MTNPRATVLLPVHNGQPFLAEAVESLLTQTYADFELVVVDDGSTDGSAELVASYRDARIRLIRNGQRLGLVPTLNRGLELARGALIARQDADDRSHPRRLAEQVRFLHHHPDVALLGTQARVIDRGGRVVGGLDRSREAVSIRWYHLFDNSFLHSSVMMRREAVQSAGNLAYEPLTYCEDYALWSKLALRYPAANLEERLIDYRAHSGSVYGGLSAEQAAVSASGNRVIIQRNLQEIFGAGTSSGREAELLCLFRTGVPENLLAPFLRMFRQLLHRYQDQFPESRRSPDFQHTVARQYDEMAYKVVPSTRAHAIAVYWEGLCQDPGLAWRFSWPRVLALSLLGKSGRRRLRELGGRGESMASPQHEPREPSACSEKVSV